MTFNASPEVVRLAMEVEDELVHWWAGELHALGSNIVVVRSPFQDDPRLNAIYGDIWFRRTEVEAPFVVMEAKAPNYPFSFSLSDVENRISQARWVTVKGSVGIWHVKMSDARDCYHVKDEKYGTCAPRLERIELTVSILDELRTMAGEL